MKTETLCKMVNAMLIALRTLNMHFLFFQGLYNRLYTVGGNCLVYDTFVEIQLPNI